MSKRKSGRTGVRPYRGNHYLALGKAAPHSIMDIPTYSRIMLNVHYLHIFIAIITICLGSDAFANPSNPSAIQIGMLVPLSGGYTAMGEDNRQGMETGMRLSKNGSRFHLIYSDSKADPKSSVSEFRKLTDVDKVFSLYVMRSPVGMAVNPISLSSKIPILGGVGDKNFAAQNPYAFQLWSKSDVEGAFLASRLIAKNFKRVAVVTTEDDWTSSVTQGLRDEFKRSGRSLVFDELVFPSDNEFRTVVSRLKGSNPDVVVVNVGLEQIGIFLKQMREQRMVLPTYSNFWVQKKDVVQAAGTDLLDNVKFIEMDTNYPIFRKELFAQYGTTPSGATLSAYIGALLLAQASSEDTSINTPQEFYAALRKQAEVRTPDGNLSIKDRCVQFPLVERVMRDGKPQTVDG